MKRVLLIAALLIIMFAALLPFASRSPDGLQTITATSESKQQPAWNGLMANYSAGLEDPYISTLVAGICGVGIVLGSSFALGAAMSHKKNSKSSKKM